MRRWRIFWCVLVVGFGMALTGCRGGGPAAKVEQKSYHLRGKIVAVGTGQVTVNAGAIPGLMEAMTMDYKLVDPTVASELHPGDIVTAQVLGDQSADGPTNVRLDQIGVGG